MAHLYFPFSRRVVHSCSTLQYYRSKTTLTHRNNNACDGRLSLAGLPSPLLTFSSLQGQPLSSPFEASSAAMPRSNSDFNPTQAPSWILILAIVVLLLGCLITAVVYFANFPISWLCGPRSMAIRRRTKRSMSDLESNHDDNHLFAANESEDLLSSTETLVPQKRRPRQLNLRDSNYAIFEDYGGGSSIPSARGRSELLPSTGLSTTQRCRTQEDQTAADSDASSEVFRVMRAHAAYIAGRAGSPNLRNEIFQQIARDTGDITALLLPARKTSLEHRAAQHPDNGNSA